MSKALSFETEVTGVVLETMDVLTFRLAIPADIPFSFKAGQFIKLTAETPEYAPEHPTLTRAYSISNAPLGQGYIDLTVKCYEDGHLSKHLREVTYIGELMTVEGPFGDFCFEAGQASSIALIGGGAGVAPMRGMMEYIIEKKLPVQMHYLASCRTPQDLIYLATLLGWQESTNNLHVTHTITRPEGHSWAGQTGHIDQRMLLKVCPPETTELYYVAGPTEMVKSVRKLLKEELNVDKSRILWEPWG